MQDLCPLPGQDTPAGHEALLSPPRGPPPSGGCSPMLGVLWPRGAMPPTWPDTSTESGADQMLVSGADQMLVSSADQMLVRVAVAHSSQKAVLTHETLLLFFWGGQDPQKNNNNFRNNGFRN